MFIHEALSPIDIFLNFGKIVSGTCNETKDEHIRYPKQTNRQKFLIDVQSNIYAHSRTKNRLNGGIPTLGRMEL